MSGRNFKGVLFDFDGVLAKTMEDNFEAWKLVMNDFGAAISPQEYFPLEGMKLIGIAELFCKKYQIASLYAETIVKKKDEYYFMITAGKQAELYPGVEDFTERLLERCVPLAIVSAGFKERLDKSVSPHFLGKFKAIITGEKTKRGKPFPDPYLKAAEELELLPQECIAVENSPLGIQSAKSAGAYCIAIASTVSRDKLNEADEVVAAFRDLLKLDTFLWAQ